MMIRKPAMVKKHPKFILACITVYLFNKAALSLERY